MIIGAGLDGRLGLDFATLRDLGIEATAMGFESIWTPSGGVPDAFHLCAGWAQATIASHDRATPTGIAVVPAPRYGIPWTIAIQAATVSLISGGNFILGLGTGGSGKEYFDRVGLANRPISVMRDYLEITRALLRGEKVSYQGAALSMRGERLGLDLPTVPIYLAALGPQMLRLAGSAADGASLNWATPDAISRSRAEMNRGASSAGRDPSSLKLSMYIRVCVDDDVRAARRALAAQVLGYAIAGPGDDPTLAYRGLFSRMGFDEPLRELEFRRNSGASIADLVDDVPEDLLQAIGYYGTPDGAAGRFRELSVGLDEAIVRVITTAPSVDKVRLALETLSPVRVRACA
jgi:5,10-methylenetetrahydromethanopterin reductase